MTKKYDLTSHARHDAAHCLAPNLFRTLKRGDRKKLKLDVVYQYGEHESLRFIGFEPLDAGDMRLLQGLVAMAGPSTLILDLDSPKTNMAKTLIKILDPKHKALEGDSRVVKASLYSILSEIGLNNAGSQRKVAMESLLRLSNVTIVAKNKNQEWSCHLLSYGLDEDSGQLFVALNPRITEAVLGFTRYTTIDMNEVRAIKSDPAAIIHQRLCGVVDQGKSRLIKEDTLMSYIWSYDVDGKTATQRSSALRQRRRTLKKALEEISQTNGWTFSNESSGAVMVARKSKK